MFINRDEVFNEGINEIEGDNDSIFSTRQRTLKDEMHQFFIVDNFSNEEEFEASNVQIENVNQESALELLVKIWVNEESKYNFTILGLSVKTKSR